MNAEFSCMGVSLEIGLHGGDDDGDERCINGHFKIGG